MNEPDETNSDVLEEAAERYRRDYDRQYVTLGIIFVAISVVLTAGALLGS